MFTGKKEEHENHNESVSKVKESGCGILNFQFGDKIVDAIKEQVKVCKPACQKTAPPPVIVL
jgi:hypothetical protein